LAGAGTGKTETLMQKYASFIQQNVDPSQILSITFTNKAAHEMKQRIISILDWQEN